MESIRRFSTHSGTLEAATTLSTKDVDACSSDEKKLRSRARTHVQAALIAAFTVAIDGNLKGRCRRSRNPRPLALRRRKASHTFSAAPVLSRVLAVSEEHLCATDSITYLTYWLGC